MSTLVSGKVGIDDDTLIGIKLGFDFIGAKEGIVLGIIILLGIA